MENDLRKNLLGLGIEDPAGVDQCVMFQASGLHNCVFIITYIVGCTTNRDVLEGNDLGVCVKLYAQVT